MTANTIDDVIDELGKIIDWAKENDSRLGYFPALYRMVTIRIKEGIAAGEFENGPRMEKLDVVFANRYLSAFHAWQADQPFTESWKVTFDAAEKWRYIVLQHLFVGMNAHINLDLAIAAAKVAPGDGIFDLEPDFKKITNILNDLTESVQNDLAEVWPLLRILKMFSGRIEDWLAGMGMTIARDIAWGNAVNLSKLNRAELAKQIGQLDRDVAALGKLILSPSWLGNIVVRFIRLGEWKSVDEVIDIFSD